MHHRTVMRARDGRAGGISLSEAPLPLVRQGIARTEKERGIEWFKTGFGGADMPVLWYEGPAGGVSAS